MEVKTMRGGSQPCKSGCTCGRHMKPKGSASPNWVGDRITHKAMHTRVILARGSASSHMCFFHAERGQEKDALDWAQIHDTSGLDIADYIPLCRECHLRYDGRPGNGGFRPGEQTRAKMSASAQRRPRDAAGRFIAACLLVFGIFALVTPSAHASVRYPAMSSATLGDRILNKAETMAGHWYSYGAAGPTYFDCSGLVYYSASQLGVSIPRTTYGMLAGSSHLYRIPLSWARRGDLMFYGSGHVEINTGWYHTTFGAQRTGTRVWWHPWSGYWAPTMAMRFR